MTETTRTPEPPAFLKRLMDPLLSRALLLVGLTLAMLLPIDRLEELIGERRLLHEAVGTEIRAAWGGPRMLKGPLLAIPYVERVADGETTHEIPRLAVLRPESLALDVQISVEERRRGLYTAPVFSAHVRLAGRFEPAALQGDEIHIDWSRAALRFSLPKATANTVRTATLAVAGETVGGAPVQGFETVEMPLPDGRVAERGFDFEAGFELTGTDSLLLTPSALNSTIRMSGDWPHPSFVAPRLPRDHDIDGAGFRAEWRLADRTPHPGTSRAPWYPGTAIGVKLFEPVNLYATMARAVKYAVLFIALTFAACFAIEFASGRAMHLVQYGVVGLAMTLFYLTLLALAEHIAFPLAYLAAGVVIVAMIALYSWATLGSARRAGIVAGVLALLYATLFIILRMEDFALLSGSGVALLALAALMLVTRRLGPKPSE